MNEKKDKRFLRIEEVAEILGLDGKCQDLYTGGYNTQCLLKVRQGRRCTQWVRAQVERHADILATVGVCSGECREVLSGEQMSPLSLVKSKKAR